MPQDLLLNPIVLQIEGTSPTAGGNWLRPKQEPSNQPNRKKQHDNQGDKQRRLVSSLGISDRPPCQEKRENKPGKEDPGSQGVHELDSPIIHVQILI